MFKLKNENGWRHFWESEVLPSGQTIKIVFQEDESDSKYYFFIYLVIMDKRKSETSTILHTTGQDGILGLIWAKQKIVEFEEFVKDAQYEKPVIICCGWDDNRRRDVYARGLKSLGYKFTMLFGRKILAKQITT